MSESMFAGVENLSEQQIKALDALQSEYDKLDEAFTEEQTALVRKYNQKRSPLYRKQKDVVKQIPGFWKQVFESHPTLMQLLDADDVDILEKMTDISAEESQDGKSAALVLTFAKNPHFSNTTLKKEIKIKKGTDDKEEIHVSHTPIDWIKGRKRKADDEDEGIFSSWYSSDEKEDMIFEIIKDDIVPRALKFFAGVLDEGDGAMFDDESEAGDESEDIEASEDEKPTVKKPKKQ